jgi:hypothetical protein
MKSIIISQPWGGLGDNLQYSTLPQLYTERGYDVYISKQNVYRNREMYDLVWKLNPYIKGESDEEPNAGACVPLQFVSSQFITNVEKSHGLQGTRIYPSIYYTPKKIPSLENTLLYDMTSVSSSYGDDYIDTRFTSIFNMYPTLSKKKIIFKNIANRSTPDFHTDVIEVQSIFDYCDLIYSCKIFTCLFSGGAVLASAIKQDDPSPIVHCIHTSTCDIFMFDNIMYHIG